MEASIVERVTLPASRAHAVLTIILALASTFVAFPWNHSIATGNPELRLAPSTLSTKIDEALSWLEHNQSSDGSYGSYREHWAAAAAYALWINSTTSRSSVSSYSWLAQQINSSSAWFWGQYGEADVPGAALYSLAQSSHLAHVNTTLVTNSLFQLHSPGSGFLGYFNGTLTVTSSVDTDMALLGLMSAGEISAKDQTDAIGYVLTLQNSDGSFNLTSSRSFDSFYSLGPDPASITALTLLVLKNAGFTNSDPRVSSAIRFLNSASSSDFDGHVYAASLSTLALKAYNEPANAITASVYILSQQNVDHGFSDISRSSTQSNALDTGWAAVALETGFSQEPPTPPINSPPIAAFVYSPTTIIVGATVHFDAGSSRDSDSDQLLYAWTFGDGSSANGLSTNHIYSQAGNFTVTLTVTDSGVNPASLSSTKTLAINVQPTSIQRTPSLPLGMFEIAIFLGIAGVAIVVGLAIYLTRRRTRPEHQP